MASVVVDEQVIARIGRGLLLFSGFGRGDEDLDFSRIAERVLNMRVFADHRQRLMYSALDIGADVLVVPQFTLYARTHRGRRPDFSEAMEPEAACPCFDEFVAALQGSGQAGIFRGRFGAEMAVSLVNDGPFTLYLEY